MATEEVTLLIDGDVIAFTAASAVQHTYEDSFGFIMPFANKAEGEAVVDNMLLSLELDLKATHKRLILSDPKENWRMDVWPAYKGNRDPTMKPLLLDHLKGYLREKYQAEHWAELEADDVLGILNTEPQEYPGKRIIVARDKDMKTIPGLYHCLKNYDLNGKPIVFEITEWEATRFHLFQTLKGDMTDGYPGCPGIGDKRAEELLASPVMLRATEGVVTRGPRKGETTVKWVSEPTRDYWAMVVSQYRKAGQGEAEALITARLANILRNDQYDRETGEITLWTPDRIKLS